eukprot:GFKZ01005565.1.p1 GENE.GFKZ01005565.1~~GFKZ01005565.1.p1  ORF type:complete len:443 (+),score=100.30 GFKZ01005565.1:100-1428(+)
MVSAATKRKRRDRRNRAAEAVEDARVKAAAERDVLGISITPSAPDSALFTIDRKGLSKTEVRQELYQQAAEQRRAAKRARRSQPKERKSERVGMEIDGRVTKVGRKKRGGVDLEILKKRNFDKPVGHVGNRSEGMRKEREYKDGREDVWMGEMSRVVEGEIGKNRRKIVHKMNEKQRAAVSVLTPKGGLSINPTHEDHQDKLGEALAKIVTKDDVDQWDDDMMRYDPKLLEESREGEVADTGMKVDVNDSDLDDQADQEVPIVNVVPERKTRAQRNKEARKREMASNIAKKRRLGKQAKDFENILLVAEEAKRQAEKLSGEKKIRRREANKHRPRKLTGPVLKKIAGQQVRHEGVVEPVTLSTELSVSMRDIKMPKANPMLKDRFLSFERRGLIEPPSVLPKEVWRMEQEKRQEMLKDRRKRKGRGSRSNLTFWKNGKRVIQ